MCIPTKLQQNIIDRTREGDSIAAFLVDTMQGQHTDAKFCHRLEAAKHLIKYGFTDTDCETTSDRLSRAGGNPVEGQGGDETPVQSPLSPGERARVRGEEITNPVTHLDILNYEIAHLIRHETAEGHTIANFLMDIMTGRDRPFTPKKFRIKPADRMAVSKRTPASRLWRPRLTPQALRHHRRSKRLRHPAHRPRQANARVQRARSRHRPLPARSDVRSRP